VLAPGKTSTREIDNKAAGAAASARNLTVGLNIPAVRRVSLAISRQNRASALARVPQPGGAEGSVMTRFTFFPALVVICAMPLVPLSAEDPESQSVAVVESLKALLAQQKLDAVAARDPEQPGRYVAAFYMPGSQLLVVSAPYAAPAAIDKKIAAGQYMDAYVDLQSVADHTGHFFVVDMQADGLRKAVKLDEAFDSTVIEGGAPLAFDGKWEAQKMTEAQYNARFAQDDERYARMLGILRAALARKIT
jgi:hypothetical protein